MAVGFWGRRRRHEDRVRRATATLRGAALAVATAAAALAEQLGVGDDCPPGDLDCLTGSYAALLAHRRRVDDVADEMDRLEQAAVRYDGRVPADAPRLGGELPTVIAARTMVDRAHDRVLEALAAVRDALALLDPELVLDGARG